jgi:hypothetical protein
MPGAKLRPQLSSIGRNRLPLTAAATPRAARSRQLRMHPRASRWRPPSMSGTLRAASGSSIARALLPNTACSRERGLRRGNACKVDERFLGIRSEPFRVPVSYVACAELYGRPLEPSFSASVSPALLARFSTAVRFSFSTQRFARCQRRPLSREQDSVCIVEPCILARSC